MTTVASADVLVLDNGKTMKVKAYSVQDGRIHVVISERSEMVIPVEWVREIRVAQEEPELEAQSESVPEEMADFAYADLVLSLSKKHEVDWRIVAAVIAVESNYDPNAVSPKGARGLMQLMPETAILYDVSDIHDPVQNIDAGVRHLKMLMERYSGKLDLALAAYNSGEKTVDRYHGIPPYVETRAYVRKVLQRYQSL